MTKFLINFVEQKIFISADKLLPCQDNMASSGLRESLYLPKLYLPQKAPMDVKRETYGTRGGFGTPLCRTILSRVVDVMLAFCTLPPVWQKGGCGTNVGPTEKMLLQMEGSGV